MFQHWRFVFCIARSQQREAARKRWRLFRMLCGIQSGRGRYIASSCELGQSAELNLNLIYRDVSCPPQLPRRGAVSHCAPIFSLSTHYAWPTAAYRPRKLYICAAADIYIYAILNYSALSSAWFHCSVSVSNVCSARRERENITRRHTRLLLSLLGAYLQRHTNEYIPHIVQPRARTHYAHASSSQLLYIIYFRVKYKPPWPPYIDNFLLSIAISCLR